MKVLLTDKLLDDIGRLPKGLIDKAHRVAVEFTRLSRQEMGGKLTAGWRIHRLKSSPFVSFSLDMNYRLLCRIDGETIALHRILKHDLADNPQVNRDDSRCSCLSLISAPLRIPDLYGCLHAIGIKDSDISPLFGIMTEDDFLSAVQSMPPAVAELALSLLETDRFVYVRTKYCVLNRDDSFEKWLLKDMSTWELYLHPSQNFIVRLPVDSRILVEGGAGTGKTVCAWHRAKCIADAGKYVAFICPTNRTLEVSKTRLEALLGHSFSNCLFSVPGSAESMLEVCEASSHFIIDEAQDIPVKWWKDLRRLMKCSVKGFTCFVDPNQKRNNSKSQTKFADELNDLDVILSALPDAQRITLTLNYRNSREISDYFVQHLNNLLPYHITTDVPLFEAPPVYEKVVRTEADALAVGEQFNCGK